MNTTGNIILITGGGSGIGRGLAEAFHKLGNQVIIAGRRQQVLNEVTATNPGMESEQLDIQDPASIKAFAKKLEERFPELNVVIHNSGIMRPENFLDQSDAVGDAEAMIATNLLGPIRLTAALMPLLKQKDRSTIITVSSGLAFVPIAMASTYCATKAGIHSFTMSLRHQLKDTNIEVLEIIPPYVQTTLMDEGQAADPRAMPLDDYIAEVMQILKGQPDAPEIVVERCKPLRHAVESGTFQKVFAELNSMEFH